MYTDAEDLVHEIYCRSLRSLTIANSASLSLPVASVRLVLHLALSELADRMAQPQPQQPEQPIAVASAITAAVVPDVPAANVTVDSDSEPQPKKRMGRPPKAKPEHRSAEPQPVISPYNIAVAAPAAIGIDPDLVTSDDDDPIIMTGILRREETVTKHVNGVPTAVTRQYIELR